MFAIHLDTIITTRKTRFNVSCILASSDVVPYMYIIDDLVNKELIGLIKFYQSCVLNFTKLVVLHMLKILKHAIVTHFINRWL